jgi:Uma2 family endonuclease
MMAVRERLITYDEFDLFTRQDENLDRNFELINGEIIEKMPTELHGYLVSMLIIRIGSFILAQASGRIVTEVRSRIPTDDHNARQPDISYFADDTRPIVTKGAVPLLPDLAVEVKSPDDSYVQMRDKASYYLRNGSRLVWLVFPTEQQIEIHTADAPITKLDIADTLTGGDVLPGFTLPLKDIFKA